MSPALGVRREGRTVAISGARCVWIQGPASGGRRVFPKLSAYRRMELSTRRIADPGNERGGQFEAIKRRDKCRQTSYRRKKGGLRQLLARGGDKPHIIPLSLGRPAVFCRRTPLVAVVPSLNATSSRAQGLVHRDHDPNSPCDVVRTHGCPR